jgi:hypothetical protein
MSQSHEHSSYLATPKSTTSTTTITLVQMFSIMYRRVLYMLTAGKSLQFIWEDYLSHEGFIPRSIKQNIVSNDRFGFIHNGLWKEWSIVNVTTMRMYWDNLLIDLQHTDKQRIEEICKSLLNTLPGKLVQCQCCTWHSPQTEMWNDSTCSYCYNKRSTTLKSFKGSPYIAYVCR